ncbi:hypothetical protein EYF80_042936 [Liparis tanakae]|uniref:Uncharacterized protein n=1 Tax=Liparis tanakae TaxID=230148 RepID=A0A4Z2G149_9TELE|nr:hypothetical protein EYF80_042936 [Liparis tanakae]
MKKKKKKQQLKDCRWLFFQATVWKRVEMMKSELSPAPYTQADSRSHWSSDWKCNTELPSRLGIIHNWMN